MTVDLEKTRDELNRGEQAGLTMDGKLTVKNPENGDAGDDLDAQTILGPQRL